MVGDGWVDGWRERAASCLNMNGMVEIVVVCSAVVGGEKGWGVRTSGKKEAGRPDTSRSFLALPLALRDVGRKEKKRNRGGGRRMVEGCGRRVPIENKRRVGWATGHNPLILCNLARAATRWK